MARGRQQLTDEERAERREQKRKDAEERLDLLLSEEGWAAWLRLRRNLHSFSWANQVQIAMQARQQAAAAAAGYFASQGWQGGAPDTPCDEIPTLVKAAYRWKHDGYHPAQGTRGLYIWVFKSRRRKDNTWRCCGKTLTSERRCPKQACGKVDHYFQLGPVFDASQARSFETGERPVIELPQPQPVEGQDPGGWLCVALADHAVEAGWC